MERKILLTLSYDGSGFEGWQIQKRGRTVQGEMEQALLTMHRHPVRITAAGRTDSGVHAMGQTAHFTTDLDSVPPGKFVPALNGLLPHDIRVIAGREVHQSFHARYDATSREYRYLITWNRKLRSSTASRAWFLARCPSVSRLNMHAREIIGTRDFTACCSAGDPSNNRVRKIDAAVWYPMGTHLVFVIRGNAFLWKMVRSLVGTMVELEASGAPQGSMGEILNSRDRSRAGTTAPAHGLCLWEVQYG